MRSILTFAALALAVALSACDDPTAFQVQPRLFTDTIQLAAQTAVGADSLPTALDITVQGFGVVGGRFPERLADAGAWDFLVRVEKGAVVLIPSGALGIESRAGISPPLSSTNFETLRDVPKGTTFATGSATALQSGAIYVIRSRFFALRGSSCQQFAKVQPLSVDPVAGLVTLRVTTNEVCGDQRLVVKE